MTNRKPKILAFSGSARKGSFNQQLASVATKGAESAGADVTVVNLGDYPLPLFNEDLEKEQTPENLATLKQLFMQSDALLIASPEYNSSVSPLLKNTIDWLSRPAEGEPMLAAFSGKVVGLMAASPGGLGGLRGLVHLRSILSNINCLVIPNQMAIAKSYEAFDGDGNLVDSKQQDSIMQIGAEVAETTQKLIS